MLLGLPGHPGHRHGELEAFAAHAGIDHREHHGVGRRALLHAGQRGGAIGHGVHLQALAFELLTPEHDDIPDAVQALREMRRVLAPGGKLLFCEHGRAPDESVRNWQDRLQPLWGPLAGGCHLGRDIPALLDAAGFAATTQAAYLPGPRPMTFHYWGEAQAA